MGVRVRRWHGSAPAAGRLEAELRDEGLRPHRWGNGPGDTYGWHEHPYHKVLCCEAGGITFHIRDGTSGDGTTGGGDDVELGPGDRLEIEPGTAHAATVGPDGVSCVEAAR